MRRTPTSLLAALACVLPLLLSCNGDPPDPVAPEQPQDPEPGHAVDTPARPTAGIFDASSTGGNPFFHWLTPIRENGEFTGTFDATLAPRLTVEVCALSATGECAGAPLRTYAAGSDQYESIQVSPRREYYQVYFDTRASDVDPATHYRVSVLADGDNLLGYADVDVVASAGDLAGVDRDEFVGVVKGDWLAIRWRAEEGVLTFDPSPSVSITAPEDGASFAEGTNITFTGTASDPQDGDLSAMIAWSSNADGALDTGASITATLSVGTHTVTASVTDADGNTSSAEITVTVTEEEEPPPPPTGDCSGVLVNGRNHLCAISTPGEVDEFTFTATAGEYVVLTMAEVVAGSELRPWLRLISPTGEVIEDVSGTVGPSSVAQAAVVVPAAGTYRVLAATRDQDLNGTGDYMIRLAEAPSAFEVPADDEGGALTNGANHPGTIEVGDLDQWSFTATAGEFITLSMAEVDADSPLRPWLRLVSPTGEVVRNVAGGVGPASVAQINMNVPVAGTYRVIAATLDQDLNGAGDYRIVWH